MPDRFSKRILDYLSHDRYRPSDIATLARDLNIDEDGLDDFAQAADELTRRGEAVWGKGNTLVLPPPGREMVGTFRLNPRGFGFLVPDSPVAHGDLFIPAPNTGGALTGDRVRARVILEARRGNRAAGRSPYIGRIVEVLKRADRQYVGNLIRRGSMWVVEVDSQTLPDPVVIRDVGAKNARAGDKVVIEIVRYATDRALPEGVIIEVLGEQGEPDVETVAVMRAFGLEEAFDEAVLEEARVAAQSFDESTLPEDREDLTDLFCVTIDPPDARDFDDAISLERLKNDEGDGGVYELGVHIADVAYFVSEGGVLDAEACRRGNSTYLPRRVVPMLPELLSNGVCSLQEGVNRFARSAFIRYDEDGKRIRFRVTRSVIRSRKRLTYLEAQALIDGDIKQARKHAKTDPKYPRELTGALKLMDELARKVRRRRLGQGMIVLDLPEVELIFDESGHVIDARPEDDAFTHKLIEMFMVEANEVVAEVFDLLGVPMIRRVHPDPPPGDTGELRRFARVAGFNVPSHPSRRELQQLLDAVRGKPAQFAVHLAVLQTLSKAEYAPLRVGHFALASEHYTHFTSPIRRYADLIVHRALDALHDAARTHGLPTVGSRLPSVAKRRELARHLREDPRCPDEKHLSEIGRHCSTTERNSESAERELRNYLVMDLLSEHIGEDYAGTVTGMTNSGVFIQLDRFLVDGFIRLADLPRARSGDRWRLNRTTGSLTAQRSGATISIGDRFTVRVANVSPTTRKLDLVILDDHPAGDPKKPRRQPKGARKAHQKTMALKQAVGLGKGGHKTAGGVRKKSKTKRRGRKRG